MMPIEKFYSTVEDSAKFRKLHEKKRAKVKEQLREYWKELIRNA
jgi:hypothetical protein